MKDNEFLKMQLDYEKLVQDAEKGIIKNYSKAFKKLKKKLEKVYEMYEKDGQLTMDEMRKYGRLEKLEREAKLAVTELYKNNKKFINRSMRDIVKATEEKSFSIIDNKQSISPIKRTFDVEELINKAVAGRVWTERIDHYGSNFVYDIHTIIRQGIENGDTYTTTSKALKDKFGKEVGNTARIVRTESKRIQEFTAFKTMGEVDKEVKLTKTWRTMKDGAVRSSHKKMKGITVGMDEEFTLPSGITTLYPTASGDPAEDINCRCYIEYDVEKDISEKAFDIAEALGYSPIESDAVVSTLRKESEKWIAKLNFDEKKSINKYTFNGVDKDGKRLFEKINGYLENKYTPEESEEETIIRSIYNIEQGLLKNSLNRDIVVYRNESNIYSLNKPVKKFLSTSVAKKGVLGGRPNVAIIIPRGSSGAYIENLAVKQFKRQREFLLNKDFNLKEVYRYKNDRIYIME